MLQLAPEEEQLLGPAHREGRHEQRSAAGDRLVHLARQRIPSGLLRMAAVPVGALEEQGIRRGRRVGIGEERRAVSAQVPGEEDPLPVREHLQERAAHDVSRPAERDRHARHLDGPIEPDRLESRDRRLRLRGGVEGQGRVVFAVSALVGEPRVLFLEMRAVREEQGGEVPRSFGAEDAPDQVLPDQPGKIAGVVDVRVGEEDRVELARGPRRPVALAQLAPTLEQSGVDEHTRSAVRREQVPRPGHRPGRAEERQGGHGWTGTFSRWRSNQAIHGSRSQRTSAPAATTRPLGGGPPARLDA